jgi:hypothetical protein
MNAVQTKYSPERKINRPALEVRFQFVDGTEETFLQSDAEMANAIRHRVNASPWFGQPRIVVADDYSKSVFICSQINRIDFVFDGDGFSHIPDDHADLVEVPEAQFRKRVPLNNPSVLQKRNQPQGIGDWLVSFLNLRIEGGSHVYLMNEILVKLPADNQSYMRRLLSKGTFGIRLAGGGQSYLNLANLIGYTVYPGVAPGPSRYLDDAIKANP